MKVLAGMILIAHFVVFSAAWPFTVVGLATIVCKRFR
jgi:hypothetical protein